MEKRYIILIIRPPVRHTLEDSLPWLPVGERSVESPLLVFPPGVGARAAVYLQGWMGAARIKNLVDFYAIRHGGKTTP